MPGRPFQVRARAPGGTLQGLDPASERAAAEAYLPEIYDQLRALAGSYLAAERPGHTLQPTALVHEAWMKVLGQTGVAWKNPGHLRAVSVQAMRRVLVDYARRKQAGKRGGGERPLTLSTELVGTGGTDLDVLDLEAALEKLAQRSERQAQIIELHVFGGLTQREVAETLELSLTTVEDDWRVARAWLNRELGGGPA